MNYSKIENSKVYYRLKDEEEWIEIDQIDKDDLLVLLDKFISEEDFKLEDFNEDLIKNDVHRIIYEDIYNKFKNLNSNKDRFNDESNNRFKEAFNKYRID
ncbi:hypothetical protein KPL28_09535 [Clostridium algidicarnis]|uniref:hypothetical protein n=1 Tax=Clostridium algidicarnis TaxID=37659 RepID=UPI001C0CF10B|nr:hypothetical protein [Clostridium algidicarnis]MBU3209861.1 hypothetical protein [Clostridium algidicarnis]